jgi:hypothetical protein
MCPKRYGIPKHLRAIPELDLTDDLIADHFADEWVALGSWSEPADIMSISLEEACERQTLLVPPSEVKTIFEKLTYVGNALHGAGSASSGVRYERGKEWFFYEAFYDFKLLGLWSTEPLVCRPTASALGTLFINPDILLHFDLEPRGQAQCGWWAAESWWDPSKGVEVLRRRVVDGRDRRDVVEIRRSYLESYLRDRNKTLLVGHYRHLRLFDPSRGVVDLFKPGEITLRPESGRAKAIVQSLEVRTGISRDSIMRRLHLWLAFGPTKRNRHYHAIEDLPFDVTQLMFPTHKGSTAPAAFLSSVVMGEKKCAGVPVSFLTRIFFRQEVLQKYEDATGFRVDDNGSVHCGKYWGLVRSVERIGNALLCTSIGDFAEEIPPHEWLHWHSHAVPPPDKRTLNFLMKETSIPSLVDAVLSALGRLNESANEYAANLELRLSGQLWGGTKENIAVRRLKRVYADNSGDDEFLERATLLSTLVVDEIRTEFLREMLRPFGKAMHLEEPNELRIRVSRSRHTISC